MSEDNEKETGFPSQENALQKKRRELKILEESLHEEIKKNEKLQKEIDRLKKENEKLKKELSSCRKLPKWVKSNKSEKEKKAAKKLGPKKGHAVNSRKRPEKIDFEINVVPEKCPHCQSKLPKPHKWHCHIQIEIPEILKYVTTKFNVGWSYCKYCGKEVSSKERLSYSKYGPRIHAQICYWKFSMGLTLGKIAKFLKDQYELTVSTGQISEIISRSASYFEDNYNDIGTSLMDQPYLHADESGWRNGGDNHWLWSFSNKDISYYVIDKSRGQKVVENALGKTFNGVLITDFYSSYNEIDCKKQKCWTHLLRELRELKQKYSRSTEVQYFSTRLKKFFKRSTELQKYFESGGQIDKQLDRLEMDTHQWSLKNHRHPELKRVAKRMWKHRDELYTFIKAPGVGATNNAAEREVRPAVLMRKISYCNRSDNGTKNQAILMSSIRTAEKQNQRFVPMATQHLISTRI